MGMEQSNESEGKNITEDMIMKSHESGGGEADVQDYELLFGEHDYEMDISFLLEWATAST